jgi:hypothetical protein
MNRKRTVYRPARYRPTRQLPMRVGIPSRTETSVAQASEKASGANYAASVEQVARIVGVGALLLYVTGLVAVNGYLLRFGVSDFSLLRTRFVYTGGWIVATILASNALFFGLMIPAWGIAKHSGGSSREGATNVIMFLSLAMTMVVAVNMFQWFVLDVGRPSPTPTPAWPFSRAISPAAIVVLSAVGLGYVLFQLFKEISSSRVYDHPEVGHVALAWIVIYSALAIAFLRAI